LVLNENVFCSMKIGLHVGVLPSAVKPVENVGMPA
jgi:hypothetical protein